MNKDLRDFLKVYLAIVAVLFLLGLLLAVVANQPLLLILVQVYFWVGIAYVGASTLAWTGFANIYRYSPTLFTGSPSYRQQVVGRQIWNEGRDNRALLIGLTFGIALIGLAAVLFNPIFLLADVLGAGAILLARRALHSRTSTKS